MRILIVSIYFPPERSIASLRPYSWAKYWSRGGHDVTVLTSKKAIASDNWYPECGSFKVISADYHIPFSRKRKLESEDVFKAGYKAKEQTESKNTKENVSDLPYRENPFIKQLKRIYRYFVGKTGCFGSCRFPDWTELWVRKAIKKVSPADYDVLVTTAGPYTVHRGGLYFKKQGFRGKWICDWRDLWTENQFFKGMAIFRSYEKSLEQKIHQTADAITTVGDSLVDFLTKITTTPVFTIYNGMDEDIVNELFKVHRRLNEKFTIAYTGTFYDSYIPQPFFEALRKLKKEGVISPKNFQFVYAGNCGDGKLTSFIKAYKLEDISAYKGILSINQSLQIQYDSDAMLYLTIPYMKAGLSGKIFEHLYIARDIICVNLEKTAEMGKIIDLSNAGLCFAGNSDAVYNYIKFRVQSFQDNKDFVRNKNMEIIRQFSRERQAEKLMGIIKELAL